jgi:hypothetical protein
MHTIVWVMIVIHAHGNIWNMGPEFSSKEKCEVAVQAINMTVNELRWGLNSKQVCIRIEK